MEATILKIEKHKSKTGADFYYIFFKNHAASKSYKTCVATDCRNYRNWKSIIDKNMIGAVISGMNLIGKSLIDADSPIRILPPAPVPLATCEWCGKPLSGKSICQFQVNTDKNQQPNEDKFKTITIHTKCRDKIFEDSRDATQRKAISERLFYIATFDKTKAKTEDHMLADLVAGKQ